MTPATVLHSAVLNNTSSLDFYQSKQRKDMDRFVFTAGLFAYVYLGASISGRRLLGQDVFKRTARHDLLKVCGSQLTANCGIV